MSQNALILIAGFILFLFIGILYVGVRANRNNDDNSDESTELSNLPKAKVLREDSNQALKRGTYETESVRIKNLFNALMGTFVGIVLIQGIGAGMSVGKVLQEYFGISRVTSVLVIWLFALPLLFLLRAMQLMTMAILVNKDKLKD